MTRTCSMLAGVVVLTGLLLLVNTSRAEIIAPTFATGTAANYGSPTNLINGNGLSGVGPILTQTHESIHTKGWLKDNNDANNELIFSWVGETADLQAVHIWQYTQGCCTDRGVETFDISFSTDYGTTYSIAEPIAPPLVEATGGAVNEIAQTRTFTAQTGVTNVKFSNMNSYGGAWQGLNEVRFEGVVTSVLPYEPPAGSVPVGNDLTARDSASDNSSEVLYTNYVPMPDAGTVDSVSVFFQGSNLPFELFQLRPTGNADEYDVVYRSGDIIPFGTTVNQIESFPLANGPTDVLAGDVFAHYGRGIPFTINGGSNQHKIFYPVDATAAPQIGDLLTINDTSGTSSRVGPLPVFDQWRDYSMAVNFTPVPEPGGIVLAVLGVVGLAIGFRRRSGRVGG